jgi:hypothetical protein
MLVRLIHICIICRRQVLSCKIKSHKLLVLCAILNSALTTKAVKEGTTIEPLGGVVDPEVQGETTCRRFLEFYSAEGNKILPSSTPVPTHLLTFAGILQSKPMFLSIFMQMVITDLSSLSPCKSNSTGAQYVTLQIKIG